MDADIENNADTADADEDIQPTSTRGGQDFDFLISAEGHKGADIYFQHLRMRMRMHMLKIMQISADADADMRSTSI